MIYFQKQRFNCKLEAVFPKKKKKNRVSELDQPRIRPQCAALPPGPYTLKYIQWRNLLHKLPRQKAINTSLSYVIFTVAGLPVFSSLRSNGLWRHVFYKAKWFSSFLVTETQHTRIGHWLSSWTFCKLQLLNFSNTKVIDFPRKFAWCANNAWLCLSSVIFEEKENISSEIIWKWFGVLAIVKVGDVLVGDPTSGRIWCLML